MTADLAETFTSTVNSAFVSVIDFIPRLVSGLIVLLLGLIIASFLKQILLELFKLIKLDGVLKRYGVPESAEGISWASILAELAKWFVIILFLVPAVDAWGLGRFVDVLNGLIMYLPNVFVAVLLLLVGFVIARLVNDLLLASIHGVSRDVAKTIATVGRWSVMVFVVLVVLNQLGIASDLIRILFAGFVAMLALAGGLAFGLGGRDAAKEVLNKLIKKT
ncbi:MAG: hypothetical protein A2857_05140 [Candidatus Levybacteria bacterium RIFCSPHIGHO2_01_FULL_36_15]|nr:MAG: hypothetical protein A2857_05140 [Candidatus Levybacteria bacterium RIFCSPHIGHO2_01_FULL_36_15]OGH37219.1 MAG: hypothetical protein A2905_05940 [Candidatus Levybacteria bacterium RIFCSPLOWO2_01_FULL_36_10]